MSTAQARAEKRRNPRNGRKLYTLVRMVLDRTSGRHETGWVGWELEALSWALERLGYPPSRYDEVLVKYAPSKVRERRRARDVKVQKERDDAT